MGEAEPSAQLMRGLVGCSPVKRHQRARATRHAGNLGAPLVLPDGGHFDVVFAPVDGFFEAVNVERHATRCEAKSVNWVARSGSILCGR